MRDLWMLGLGLYIGEGSKSNSQVRFVNSDARTVKIMIRWFTEIINLKTQNIRPSIHIYPDTDELAAKKYWSKIINIPISEFAKTQVDTRKNKSSKRHNTLPYGTIHLTVAARGNPKFGVFLFRKIMFWAEQISIN